MKLRQRTRTKYRQTIVVGTACTVLLAAGILTFINFSDLRSSSASENQKISTIIQHGTVTELDSILTTSSLLVEEGATLKLNAPQLFIQDKIIVKGILDAGTCIIQGDGSFILDDDATLIIGSSEGINSRTISGNIQVKGNRNFSKYATYVYQGEENQVTGDGIPSSVNSLHIDNIEGVELKKGISVFTSLHLTQGILTTGKYNLTLGTGTNNPGTLNRGTGTIEGNLTRWLGGAATKNVLFPLSESNNYNSIYLNLSKDFAGGFCTLRFIPNLLKNSIQLPTGSKNLCITQNGFFNMTFSEEFKNSSFKLISSVALSKNENSSYWQLIKQKEQPAEQQQSFVETPEIEVQVFPNPFKDSFTLRDEADIENEEVQLLSSTGQLVSREKFSGEYHFTKGGSLSPGIYFISVFHNGNVVSTTRLVKE